MRRFVCLLLFVFAPGNALVKIRECGGEISALRERSGSIRYPLLADSSVFNGTDNNTKQLLDVTCTWIIDSHVNQTVWIDVISLVNGSCLGLTFGDENKQSYERGERALFSGPGRTIIQWYQRNTEKTSDALHLRWNVSHSSHDPALVPYTHSDADPVSPSPSGSNRVTYTPDTPGRVNVALKTHSPGGESIQQGGGVSDLADKTKPLFPQERTNNKEETAGTWISDPMLAGTNSYSDTHSGTDTNSTPNTHTVSSREPFIASSSPAVHSPMLSSHTTPKHSSDATRKTSTPSLSNANNATHTDSHTEGSQHVDTHTVTKILSNTLRAKRADPSSAFTTASFLSYIPRKPIRSPKDKDISSGGPEVNTLTDPNKNTFTMSESVEKNQLHLVTLAITHENQPGKSKKDKANHFPLSTYLNLHNTNRYTHIYDESMTVSSTPAVSEYPDVNQSNPAVFTDSNSDKQSGHSESLDSTSGITEPSINVTAPLSTAENESTTLIGTEDVLSTKQFMHTSHRSNTMRPLTSEATTISNTNQSQTRATPASTSTDISGFTPHDHNEISAFISTSPPFLTPDEGSRTPTADTEPFSSERDCHNLTCASHEPSSAQPNANTTPESILSSSIPQINPNMTFDLTFKDITTRGSENRTHSKEPDISPSQVQITNTHASSTPETLGPEPSVYTPTLQYSPPSSENTQGSVDISGNITHTSVGQTVDVSNSDPTQMSFTTSSKKPAGLSPFSDVPIGSTRNADSFSTHTARAGLSPSSLDLTSTYTSHSSAVSFTNRADQTSTPVSLTTSTSRWDTSQTSAIHPPLLTTKQSTMTPHATSTESPSVQIHKHNPVPESSTLRDTEHMTTSSHLSLTNAHATTVTRTSWIQSTEFSSDRKWSHGKHFFIVEDQPAIIKEETFQVLLQITLEENFVPSMRLHEVELYLQSVSGYQSQHVTWHSGPVLQTVVRFQTVKALPWLGRAESLLQEAGLNPLPKTGIFVGGVKLKNIKEGGVQEDVCDWLFECPSGFQCVFSKGNASCTSVCHFDYCKHQGICVHRPEQQPLCQCPVGEDYWFMGQRCDLRMTRPRLVGVCFGVLIAVATVMALLSYLAVRRFKSMLLQAKVEQTRSSYRRFNHFDELSARFWGKSWPGSEDSLENPAFTHSDELLHLRALDRTCCYHDDSLSIVSTYHGSGTHLNTIYPHSSQYGWDLSNCSLADGVVDSGKASDLSVCSWPIEPIQWTPFPLLQQLNRNTTPVKTSRPRSYCEGMELVDLEKSWTA